jgi:hypothetical protein
VTIARVSVAVGNQLVGVRIEIKQRPEKFSSRSFVKFDVFTLQKTRHSKDVHAGGK